MKPEEYKLRLKYQRLAFLASEALLSQIDIIGDVFSMNMNRYEEWNKKTINTKRTIKSWMNADYERFKDL
jgi:hypothetical protein